MCTPPGESRERERKREARGREKEGECEGGEREREEVWVTSTYSLGESGAIFDTLRIGTVGACVCRSRDWVSTLSQSIFVLSLFHSLYRSLDSIALPLSPSLLSLDPDPSLPEADPYGAG